MLVVISVTLVRRSSILLLMAFVVVDNAWGRLRSGSGDFGALP